MFATDVQNFAFDERLVRVVVRAREPWFVGVDVCAALDLAKPENALAGLDDDEKHTLTEGVVGEQRGPKARIIVSEPGVYRLVFRSRKPAAERFKRWLAHDVLPSLRKSAAPVPDPLPAGNLMPQTYLEALSTVRELRMIAGAAVARVAWRRLGLPAIPAGPTTALDEARECLRRLLEYRVADDKTVRELIECALEGEAGDEATLMAIGVRVQAEGLREGFVVANRHLELVPVWVGTQWVKGSWSRTLRRLPEVEPAGTVRFGKVQSRGTFVPADYLDDASSLVRAASEIIPN